MNSASTVRVGFPQTVAEVNEPSVKVRVRWLRHTAFVSVGPGSALVHPEGVWFSLPVPPVGAGSDVMDSSASCQTESTSVVTTDETVTVKSWSTLSPLGSSAVTVMVAVPAETPVTVTTDPATMTVARPVALEDRRVG